ncbi:hypothetical protein [Streptomyces pseudovenezuelae]
MDSDDTPPLRLVETSPEVLVHTTADRLMASRHWLLSTLDVTKRDRARMEWQEQSVTLLPLGTLFSAVRIPERVVHAAARTDNPQMVDLFLAAALDDGPVIHDLASRRYYVLVPASMPARWHEAAGLWRTGLGVDCLGSGTLLGVPPTDVVLLDVLTNRSYWSVPMFSAGVLCDPQAVARMIAAAALKIDRDAEA